VGAVGCGTRSKKINKGSEAGDLLPDPVPGPLQLGRKGGIFP
jgi:hypothetical protein